MSEHTPQADATPEVRIVEHRAMPYQIAICGDVLLELGDERSCLIVCGSNLDNPTPQVLADLRSLTAMLNHPEVQRLIKEREEQSRSS